MLKLEKKSVSGFYFPVKWYEIRKKVMIQNCLLHKDLRVETATFFPKMYIFLFNLKNTIENLKFNFLTKICEIRNKFFSVWQQFFYIENFFYCILLWKHQFSRLQNFEDSFFEIFKFHIDKKKYVSIIFEHLVSFIHKYFSTESVFYRKYKDLV